MYSTYFSALGTTFQPGAFGAATAYVYCGVRNPRPVMNSLISKYASSTQPSVLRSSSGRKLRPCMEAGVVKPSVESREGAISTWLTISGIFAPRLNPGPSKINGTWMELSWGDRLYSVLRVLKWQP